MPLFVLQVGYLAIIVLAAYTLTSLVVVAGVALCPVRIIAAVSVQLAPDGVVGGVGLLLSCFLVVLSFPGLLLYVGFSQFAYKLKGRRWGRGYLFHGYAALPDGRG